MTTFQVESAPDPDSGEVPAQIRCLVCGEVRTLSTAEAVARGKANWLEQVVRRSASSIGAVAPGQNRG